MSKIKVLQFPIAKNSGVKQYEITNWEFISKDKFQFDFAFVRNHPDLASELKRTGAGVKYVLSSAEADRERYIKEVSAVLAEGYDVVHLHTSYWKRLLIEELAVQYKVPKIIVHSHSTFVDVQDAEERQKAERIHAALRDQFDLSLATDFCACSNAAADWLFGDKIPRSKIKILKNAIHVDKYLFNRQIRADTRKALGLDDQFVVGHIGRFSYQKNHEFLVDIFHEVCKAIPKAVLLLVGEGPLEDSVRTRAAQMGLSDKVIFAGQRNDVPALLQAMDVFCLPSRFEGLGIVLIEAQASGLPCLVSSAVPDEGVITDLATRLPLHTDLWVEQLLRLAREPRQRLNMLEPLTAAGYNIRYQIREIERLYRE